MDLTTQFLPGIRKCNYGGSLKPTAFLVKAKIGTNLNPIWFTKIVKNTKFWLNCGNWKISWFKKKSNSLIVLRKKKWSSEGLSTLFINEANKYGESIHLY